MRRLFRRRPPSIYEHIRANVADVGLTERGQSLPDEDELFEEHGFSSVPGAIEGVFGGHGDEEAVEEVCAALREFADHTSKKSRERLGRAFASANARGQVDEVLERLQADPPEDLYVLHRGLRVIAMTSGSREEVKFAIAILGGFGQDEDVELLRTFARHEEFTLYAAIALGKIVADPVGEWLELAPHVDGWGRIELVELILREPRHDACAYLLREGFRNSIMYGYTAGTVAEHCDLAGALARDPDEDLISGARDILATLADDAWGGPAGGMLDYEQALLATERFLDVLQPGQLEDFLAVGTLQDFLEDDLSWAGGGEREENERRRSSLGWTSETRAQLSARCSEILALPLWSGLVEGELAREQDELPWPALQVASKLGQPTREVIYRHLERHRDDTSAWFALAGGADAQQLRELIELFGQVFDLDELAEGPADELFRPGLFLIVDALVQELVNHPGLGWELIRPALRSPVVRNRHFALRALSSWSPEQLGGKERRALEEVATEDPDEDLRKEAQRVLGA
jgi:hypothetical protein